MTILGIETSCDECSVAVVTDGTSIRSNVVATQLDVHRPFAGVVPELASRTHTEWIVPVAAQALREASVTWTGIDGIAVTSRPGLVGSLLVGLSFAKGLAYSLEKPFIAVDHIRAHLYASHLEYEITYPCIGLIVSGGHTVIGLVHDFDRIDVLGTTIDDACGEAFDKVAKHYELGYPGGAAIDRRARRGDANAYAFPDPSLHKGEHRYDVSYSGLKTAVINQREQFHRRGPLDSLENIAASFEKAAIDLLLKRLDIAVEDTEVRTIVVGGGVAANTYLREALCGRPGLRVFFPSRKLCTDNAAMVAGIGYRYLARGDRSALNENTASRVADMKRTYP